MKTRVICASVMMIFAISICVFSYSATNFIAKNISFNIKNIETYIMFNEKDEAYTTSTKLIDDWKNQYKIFSIYVDNSLLEQCEMALNSIEKNLYINDMSGAIISCQNANTSIEQILNSQKPSFANIF